MKTGTGSSANDQEYIYYEEIDSREAPGEYTTSKPFLADPLERGFHVLQMREIGLLLVLGCVLLVFLGIATTAGLKAVLRFRKLQNRNFAGEELGGSCSLELAPILGKSQFHMEGANPPASEESDEPNLSCDDVETEAKPLKQNKYNGPSSFKSETRQRLTNLISRAQFKTI